MSKTMNDVLSALCGFLAVALTFCLFAYAGYLAIHASFAYAGLGGGESEQAVLVAVPVTMVIVAFLGWCKRMNAT